MDKYRELRSDAEAGEFLYDPDDIIALLAERDALERKAFIGSQMSNVLFNWKQSSWVPEDYRKVMNDLVCRFDAAKRQEGVKDVGG